LEDETGRVLFILSHKEVSLVWKTLVDSKATYWDEELRIKDEDCHDGCLIDGVETQSILR